MLYLRDWAYRFAHVFVVVTCLSHFSLIVAFDFKVALYTEKKWRRVLWHKKCNLFRSNRQVKALRRQQKPVSGQLGTERNQTTISSFREVNGVEASSQSSYVNSSYTSYSSSSVSVSASASNSRFSGAAGRSTGLPVKSPRRKSSVEQASRSAKKKWDVIDKKVEVLE